MNTTERLWELKGFDAIDKILRFECNVLGLRRMVVVLDRGKFNVYACMVGTMFSGEEIDKIYKGIWVANYSEHAPKVEAASVCEHMWVQKELFLHGSFFTVCSKCNKEPGQSADDRTGGEQ